MILDTTCTIAYSSNRDHIYYSTATLAASARKCEGPIGQPSMLGVTVAALWFGELRDVVKGGVFLFLFASCHIVGIVLGRYRY